MRFGSYFMALHRILQMRAGRFVHRHPFLGFISLFLGVPLCLMGDCLQAPRR
ncbi:hypothetical protein QO008_000824 [Peptoniphilus ivorii]|uniref:hypothetical protein n=1 Tax=Aedoeadaptatus ivorii TaxID=54006 RepID=UPI00277DE901|nr:hypothetical protein [Peptoniphilus ivorii]MDQ0508369.1 hypothetical protein [Peptoniphilus ivorii]